MPFHNNIVSESTYARVLPKINMSEKIRYYTGLQVKPETCKNKFFTPKVNQDKTNVETI